MTAVDKETRRRKGWPGTVAVRPGWGAGTNLDNADSTWDGVLAEPAPQQRTVPPARPFDTGGRVGEDDIELGARLVAAGIVDEAALERGFALQEMTGEPLGRILLGQGDLAPAQLYRQLSLLWRIPYVDLETVPAVPELVHRFAPETLIAEQFVPLRAGHGRLDVATARRPGARLRKTIAREFGTGVRVTFHLAAPMAIDAVIRESFREELLAGAIYGLAERAPRQSAFTVFTREQVAVLSFILVAGLILLFVLPRPMTIMVNLLLNVSFAVAVAFKFVVSLTGAGFEQWESVTKDEVEALDDADLPLYTILVPAYKEAEVVGLLMRNLAGLDYPAEKLEILLLLEENDPETVAAAYAADPPGNVHVLIVPDRTPKTKPKACNVGLFFSRGEYLVIYDAEDEPEPDQLKKALVAFRKGPEHLACVQAALNYFNATENMLTRLFTLEYSYWFDYMLPGLYRLNLPIPLGGTSNHFRTDVLRELGAWDPFNVTEDADLGVRASARGYAVGVINSTTYEEANNAVGNWIRQRSRWIKGYMQTALVHLRAPHLLVKAVGFKPAMGFLLLVVGTPLTFLAGPPMWLLYMTWLFTGTHALDPVFPPALMYLSLANLLLANTVAVYLGMLAAFKRQRYELTPWALLNPAYWILHSIAAYMALWQLFTKPFYWEKTTHGITRHVAGSASPAH